MTGPSICVYTCRMKPTNDEILEAALKLARQDGYRDVTRERIATAAGVSPALVSVRLGTMIQLRRRLMRYAIKRACLPVIAQGLAARDGQALKAPAELKNLALASLCS